MAKKLSDATFLMLRIFQIPLLHRNVGMSERQKSVLETLKNWNKHLGLIWHLIINNSYGFLWLILKDWCWKRRIFLSLLNKFFSSFQIFQTVLRFELEISAAATVKRDTLRLEQIQEIIVHLLREFPSRENKGDSWLCITLLSKLFEAETMKLQIIFIFFYFLHGTFASSWTFQDSNGKFRKVAKIWLWRHWFMN